jgi:hypothetical protein
MLARHPITGKDVRVIQTDATIWKERKTLGFRMASAKVDTVSDTLLDDGSAPMYRLVLDAGLTVERVQALAKESQILVLSAVARESLGLSSAEFKALGIRNIIYLGEIAAMYPHLGGDWDGTAEDATVLLAGLLRYNRIIGASYASSLHFEKPGAFDRATACGITIAPAEKPAELWWITQYYTAEKPKRQRELRRCLERNVKSSLIDKIILLNEKVEKFDPSEKIKEVVIGKRLTYEDVYKRISLFPSHVIAVFANADICIDDDSWKDLWSLNLEDKFLALLRYDVPDSGDVKEAKMFGPRPDSQDTWIIRAADVTKRGPDIWKNMDFCFGRMGCDNAVALEMLRQKFLVVNPSQTLKTWHFHASEIRNYSKKDILERDVFLYVEPSGANDLAPVLKWSAAGTEGQMVNKYTPAPMTHVLRGSGVPDWLRITKGAYSADSENLFVPEEEVVFHTGECFETCDGLAFDKKKMYIGNAKAAQEVWGKAQMHGLMPTLGVDKALIVPWPAMATKSREVYCLKYLSKVLRLWRLHGSGDFFASQQKFFEDVLGLFDWGTESLPVLCRDRDSLVWAKEGVGFPIVDNRHVLSEDVDALRAMARGGWAAELGEEKRIVIVEDNFLLKSDIVALIEAALEEAGWKVNVVHTVKSPLPRIVEVFQGAHGVVCSGNMACFGWNWLLPKGAAVFEINGVTTEGIDLSAAAGLQHYIINIIGPDNHEERIRRIMAEVGDFSASASSLVQESEGGKDAPTIWMPRKGLEGFFSHPGDSFREMVGLWKKAGLVNVKEHPTATMVWWGEVGAGGVLLYDRPTNEWRLAASEAEKQWRLALFGNPKVGSTASAYAEAVPWTFWPRRPQLVEELSGTAQAATAHDERVAGPVFYGKTENAVQARRRKGDWKSACSEWVMVQNDEKYPFTQKEYLEKLASARFGLCLPGYGYKCHREVECMAMGCVPVVSPEVDMDSYANPPVEGVHYLRVSTPEDVAGVVGAVSKESWEKMSAAGRVWWNENASCAGSFRLTRELIVGH